jgi:hypothetical protein
VSRDPRWALPTNPPRRRFELLRDPVRATVLGASIVLVVAARLTWVDASLPYTPHFEVSGFDHAGDGAITFVAALFTAAWALHGGGVRTRIVPIVIVPLVIGVAGLILLRIAIQDAEILIAAYRRQGGGGSIGLGLWLTVLGEAAVAIAGAAHLYRVRREVKIRVTLAAGDVGAVVGAILGVVGGIVGSSALVDRFVHTSQVAVVASAQTLGAIVLAFFGAWLGVKLGRAVAEGLRPGPIRRIGP